MNHDAGESQPQHCFLLGNSRAQLDNLRLRDRERIKITYYIHRDEQYEQLIITNIERMD